MTLDEDSKNFQLVVQLPEAVKVISAQTCGVELFRRAELAGQQTMPEATGFWAVVLVLEGEQ